VKLEDSEVIRDVGGQRISSLGNAWVDVTDDTHHAAVVAHTVQRRLLHSPNTFCCARRQNRPPYCFRVGDTVGCHVTDERQWRHRSRCRPIYAASLCDILQFNRTEK